MPSLWKSLADLRVRIDDYTVERRELAVSSSFTRVTTTVVLHGEGQTGEGEDVHWAVQRPQMSRRSPLVLITAKSGSQPHTGQCP